MFFTFRPIGETSKPIVLKDNRENEIDRVWLPPMLGDVDPVSKNVIDPAGVPKTIPKHPSGAVITPRPPPKKPATILPATNNFNIPTLGQTGRPIVIAGPFDGDSSNTSITLRFSNGSQEFEKTTESITRHGLNDEPTS